MIDLVTLVIEPLGSINLRVSGATGTVALQGLANLWREDNRLEPVSDPGSDPGDKDEIRVRNRAYGS